MGKAGIKIIVSGSYFTLIGVMGLLSLSFFDFNNISELLTKSFLCENMMSRECDDGKLNTYIYKTFGISSFIARALLAFLPIVVILLAFDPKICKKRKMLINGHA
jgi:hypothetical protein